MLKITTGSLFIFKTIVSWPIHWTRKISFKSYILQMGKRYMSVSKQSRFLLLSWMIPPSQGGSAYIIHQLAKHFTSDEMTIAGGSKQPFKGVKQYDGITYNYFFTELNWRGHGDRFFKIFRLFLFPFFVFNLVKLLKKKRPDYIIAIFPDGYFLFAGYLISRWFDVKLFSYYHNTYTENRKAMSKWIACQIQKRVFKRSVKIFLMSEGMRAYYHKAYPEFESKFEVLPHTFETYYPINSELQLRRIVPPYKLIMIGTFNASNMEASARVFSVIAKYPELFQLDIYSSSNKKLLKIKWVIDLDASGINHRGYVKQEEVYRLFNQYDACIVTHGFTGGYTKTEYETIFPTRVIPLLLSGLPILVHSPEGSFLNAFIEKYDCAELIAETSEEKLISALVYICENDSRRKALLANAKEASQYFYGPKVFKQLKTHLK
jgi:glycosyltransferase involved in cell wall biosynthesis